MNAVYNEIDPFAAQWIRNLSAAGHVAQGNVDERSIQELHPNDVAGPGQRHFFAGIAGWSLALRLAGVPDSFPVWTGSCPCQPFSCAGKGKGVEDDRHLWPDFFRLIRACRPPIIFGEQVASPAGLAWLDIVFDDLEGAGYSCRAEDICAASVGAPHIRQRLYWVANSMHARRPEGWTGARGGQASGGGGVGELANANGSIASDGELQRGGRELQSAQDAIACALADAKSQHHGTGKSGESGRAELTDGGDDDPWTYCEWLQCTDGKARPVESRVEPMVDGLSSLLGYVRTENGSVLSPLMRGSLARVGRLRGYGNAIVPQVAAEFIRNELERLR